MVLVQVYNPTDGEPVVALGTSLDNHASTYCLKLIRVFEATGYNLTKSTATDSDYTEVSSSSQDLADANCTVSETSTTTFTIQCDDIGDADATLSFDFKFKADNTTGYHINSILFFFFISLYTNYNYIQSLHVYS